MSGRTQELVSNADRYRQSFDKTDLPREPRTGVAVVSCIDVRLNIYDLLGLVEGDARVIRNAGGVITDDVVRSLALGQHLMGTREIMLIMHDGCCMGTITDEEFGSTLQASAGCRPEWTARAFTNLAEELKRGTKALRHSPFLLDGTQIGGFLYNERTGSLRELE